MLSSIFRFKSLVNLFFISFSFSLLLLINSNWVFRLSSFTSESWPINEGSKVWCAFLNDDESKSAYKFLNCNFDASVIFGFFADWVRLVSFNSGERRTNLMLFSWGRKVLSSIVGGYLMIYGSSFSVPDVWSINYIKL